MNLTFEEILAIALITFGFYRLNVICNSILGLWKDRKIVIKAYENNPKAFDKRNIEAFDTVSSNRIKFHAISIAFYIWGIGLGSLTLFA